MAKAKKIPHLNPEKDLKTCLPKILKTRFEEMIAYESGTIEGTDIEMLHNMRVASRRVQAVMKVFRAAFPKNEFKKQYKVIRGLKDTLGVVRHYDVFIDTLEHYSPDLPPPLGAGQAPESGNNSDRRAIDLLIIRQNALRERKKKELSKYIYELNRRGYKVKFMEFAEKL